MSFDDRTLRKDDSPKNRVQQKFPQYKCVKVWTHGDVSAYEAWRLAESMLILEPERKKRKGD